MIAIEPTTIDVMKLAAPMSSPTARPKVPWRTDTNVEKTSGDPFPNASNVTPAVVSDSPRYAARVARFGQKKSEAVMEMEQNRKRIMITSMPMNNGLSAGGHLLYSSSYGILSSDPAPC
jgi:hypothetical protein